MNLKTTINILITNSFVLFHSILNRSSMKVLSGFRDYAEKTSVYIIYFIQIQTETLLWRLRTSLTVFIFNNHFQIKIRTAILTLLVKV